MASRGQPSRVQRRSWREQDGPVSSSLLAWRRGITAVLCAGLLGLFGWLLWWMWRTMEEKSVRWSAATLIIADYDQQAAPPIAFAAEDQQAIESALGLSLDRKAGELKDLTGRVATDRQRLETLVEGLFAGESGGKGRGLLLYVNAHGCSQGESAYLLPSDFDAARTADSGMPVSRLLEKLAAHPAAWKVLVIDSGPLARDLRLGTAVNRFPEFLQAALEDIKLAEGQRLLVVTSHRTWEESLTSPTDRRSVFGYFFEQAIASPIDNADIACPDGNAANSHVSLAELCRFVQQQTSAWVWKHSAHTRTQRPLVLLAQGSRDGRSSVVAVEFSSADDAPQPARAGDPAAEAIALLADVTIATPSLAAQEKTAARRSPRRSPHGSPRWSSAPGFALVQNSPSQPAETPRDDKAKSGGSAASEPQPEAKQAQPPAEPPTLPPASEAPPAAAPPKPSWPKEWPAWLVALADPAGDWASLDHQWTAADYDPTWVRNQLTSVVHQQAAQRGAPRWEADSSRGRQAWLDAASPFAAEPRLIRAVRTRDALLLLLPYFIDAVDRLDDAASARLEQKLAAMIDDLHRLCDVLERPTVVDSSAGDKGSADGKQILYERLRPSSEQCDLPELEQCTRDIQESYGQVLDELRGHLVRPQAGAPASNSAGWLAGWDLAHAVPLVLIDQAASPPTLDAPKLAVINPHRPTDADSAEAKAEPTTAARPSVPASKALPSELDQNDAVKWAWSRRGRWLQLQTRLANLLREPAQPPLDAAAAKRFAASEHAAINRHGAAILDRYRAAAQRQLPLANEPPGNALECWTADRMARLAVLNPQAAAAICPLASMQLVPRRRLLELSPPRLASAPPNAATAAFQLDRGKPLAIVWDVRSEIPDQLGTVQVEVEYDEAEGALSVQGDGNQPLRARSPFVWDAKEQRLVLFVSALRDVRAEEAGSGGERKALTVRLTTDGRSMEQPAHFRLPGSPYLDVVVAGNPANLGAGIRPGEPVPPIDFGGGREPDSDAGRYHLALRPFSRGTTAYGLSLVNRSSDTRQLQARWHAVSDDGPLQPAHSVDLWQSLQRTAQKTPFATVSRKLEAGATWAVPLFEPPPMGPAGAPPAAPAPTKAPSFTRGLVCELRDDADSKWSQWIWITARPLHPLRYLQAEAKYEAAPSSEAIVATVRPQRIDGIRLPPGETTLAGSVWHAPLLAPSEPLQGDLLPGKQLEMVFPIRRASAAGASPLLALLDIDGYPRAAQFSIRPLADQRAEAKEADVLPGVRLYVLDKPKEGDEGPRHPRADSDLFFNKANKPDKLDCVVHAEFGATENLAVRLVVDDNDQRPARVFCDDRQIDITCHKPEEGSPENLLLSCAVGDLTHELNLTAYDRSRNVRLRADLVRRTGDGAWTALPLVPPAEKTLVLDLDAPVVRAGPRDERRIELPNLLHFTFTVSDNLPPADGPSGIRLEDVRWSFTEDFSKAKPISELLAATGGVERIAGGAIKLRCVLRDPRVIVPGEEVVVYAQAADRAGNVSPPTEVVVKEKQAVP